METTVSIIIAAYNVESYIRKSLDSVLKQTYQDWECLVIDGASKDATVSIAREYEQKDARFHVYSEPDKGVYDAFNKGWRKAKGEWIYYLGSDDELLPDGIESLMRCSQDVDFVYGGIVRRYSKGGTKPSLPGDLEKSMPYSLAASHQAMIMRRSVIEKVGGFNLKYKILGDYDLINHAYYVGMKTRRCDSMIAIFQLGGISTDSIKSLKERYAILCSYGVAPYKARLHCIKMAILFTLFKIKHHFQ